MLDSNQFKKNHPVLAVTLRDFFNSKNNIFPYLYAISSFNKEEMYFGVSSKKESLDYLAADLQEMSEKLRNDRSDKSKKLNTYLYIVENHDINNVSDFLISLLQGLHEIDEKDWIKNVTKDMNEAEFEFCFNGKLWFPILLSYNHPSLIRQSPCTLVAFQPSVTFDYNKKDKAEFYQRMRSSTHCRIDGICENDRPYYLSKESSGKNIVQFIGFDSSEFDKGYCYPLIGSG